MNHLRCIQDYINRHQRNGGRNLNVNMNREEVHPIARMPMVVGGHANERLANDDDGGYDMDDGEVEEELLEMRRNKEAYRNRQAQEQNVGEEGRIEGYDEGYK
eukprot:TRINITY_DN631185_c0_g2_i2.p1 TRINITY_DN631185_c0_g2~~TRINITY_DN631185_c0_g2_i2.p1  ORF type:complete len:103 (-),score=27.84 TRINITY_DN631185_c0_g2_i2:46-354(-)